jgi:hypothetical protein
VSAALDRRARDTSARGARLAAHDAVFALREKRDAAGSAEPDFERLREHARGEPTRSTTSPGTSSSSRPRRPPAARACTGRATRASTTGSCTSCSRRAASRAS